MKTKLRLLVVAMLVAVGLAVTAGAANYDGCADKLSEVGLFRGTGSGYELDRAPTRAEAATMLVRLLGKEAEAKELDYTAPYTDLAGWEKPYVQYLYDNKLTSGTSAATFSPEQPCTAQMYTTFLLRSLGYSDAKGGDFTYSGAIDFGKSVGLVDMANCNEARFLRDHVAAMSLTALNTDVKGGETALLDKLVADGAIAQDKASGLQDFFKAYNAYTAASESMSKATRMDMDASVSANVRTNGLHLMNMDIPMRVKADMNLNALDKSKMAMTGTMKIDMNPALVGQGQPSSAKMPIEYYYTDGYYYVNMEGQKVKMAMSFDEALAQMGNLTKLQSVEPICLIDSIATAGGTTTVTYSAAGMSGLVDSMLGQLGMADLAGVSMKMDDVKSSVKLEKGEIKAMDVSMKLTMTAQGETVEMDMTVNCKINALGNSINVTLPSDLNTYEEITGGTGLAA